MLFPSEMRLFYSELETIFFSLNPWGGWRFEPLFSVDAPYPFFLPQEVPKSFAFDTRQFCTLAPLVFSTLFLTPPAESSPPPILCRDPARGTLLHLPTDAVPMVVGGLPSFPT